VTDHFPASRLIERAATAGYRLTPAGRQALASPASEQIAEINAAVDRGVTFNQIATAEWDGEPCFELVVDSAPYAGEVRDA
jgi:hypothetical protein